MTSQTLATPQTFYMANSEKVVEKEGESLTPTADKRLSNHEQAKAHEKRRFIMARITEQLSVCS